MPARILVLHGPNLNLGAPETSAQVIDARLLARAHALGVELRCHQTNHQGVLLDLLAENRNWLQAVIVNPTSLASGALPLAEALELLAVPAIEVQLGNPGKSKSALREVVESQIHNKGVEGYLEALDALAPRAALKAAAARGARQDAAKAESARAPESPRVDAAKAAIARAEAVSMEAWEMAGRPTVEIAIPNIPSQRPPRVKAPEPEPARAAPKTLGRAPERRPPENPFAEKPTAPYGMAPPPRSLGKRPQPPRKEGREKAEPHGVLTRARVREQIAERLAGAMTPAALATWARARWQDLQAGSAVESGQRDRLEDVLQTLIVAAAQKASDQHLIELMVQLER